jgi:hypothetical protein
VPPKQVAAKFIEQMLVRGRGNQGRSAADQAVRPMTAVGEATIADESETNDCEDERAKSGEANRHHR